MEKTPDQEPHPQTLVFCTEQECEWMCDHKVYEKLPDELWFHTQHDPACWTDPRHGYHSVVAVGAFGLELFAKVYEQIKPPTYIHLTVADSANHALFYIASWSGYEGYVEEEDG